jgi:uncharacterized protein
MPHKWISKIFMLPGLGDSGPGHWQTLWEKQYGFERIVQNEWEKPVMMDWVNVIDESLHPLDRRNVILVGHSLACCAIAYWSKLNNSMIKAALLVAPSDTEADSFPAGPEGFAPMPLNRLSFPTIVVNSANDYYVTEQRARMFATAWGSEYVNIGHFGHINVASGHGPWQDGLSYLARLDRL